MINNFEVWLVILTLWSLNAKLDIIEIIIISLLGDVSEADLVYAWELRDTRGQQVSMDTIAKFVSSVGSQLVISGMKVLKEGEYLLGSCVIARKKLELEKFYSRSFIVGQHCDTGKN